VDMLQMRNLSIDPDYYNKQMGVSGRGIGMYRLLQRIKEEFPKVQFGYFNRTKENFFPDGYEKGWPVKGTTPHRQFHSAHQSSALPTDGGNG